MKQHLRIAADAGHSDARSAYRQLFCRKIIVPNGVMVGDERWEKNDEKEENLRRRKLYGKKQADSRMK